MMVSDSYTPRDVANELAKFPRLKEVALPVQTLFITSCLLILCRSVEFVCWAWLARLV